MNNHFNILLVDDDDAIELAIRSAMGRQGLHHTLFVAKNGRQALEMLNSGEEGGGVPRLNRIILLDCNMPVMDGLEFLEVLRSDPTLRRTPVVMLSNTENECDRDKAYDLGVCAFIRKPMSVDGFSEALSRVDRFLELAELPG